jgi:hypothetical protein
MKYKCKIDIDLANPVSTNSFSAANTFARPREHCEIVPLISYSGRARSTIWHKSMIERAVGRITAPSMTVK